MAKITERKLREVKERILHKGSFLEKEAFELGIPMEELILEFQRMYDGGVKNTQYKAVLNASALNSARVPKEELEKMRILPKTAKKRRASTHKVEKKFTSIEQPQKETLPENETDIEQDTMDSLLEKKTELETLLESQIASLEKAKELLGIRENTLAEARAVLQKAQAFVQTAEIDVEEASIAMQKAEEKLADVRSSLQQVLDSVENLKMNTVWIIDPWYVDPLPEYGILISNVEMEGVTVQHVEEEYLPKPTLEGVMKFEYVPDYKKALEFCGLVTKYELEEKSYRLCVSNEKVKDLLKICIG